MDKEVPAIEIQYGTEAAFKFMNDGRAFWKDHWLKDDAEFRTAVIELVGHIVTSGQGCPTPFQNRVRPWLYECFGEEIANDVVERNHRFLEEALELVQSCGTTSDEAHQLVDYVFNRPVGEKRQETGGVMVTLAALCLAHGIDMHECGETELARVWTLVEQICAKQLAKPKFSPLPEAVKDGQSGECFKSVNCFGSCSRGTVGCFVDHDRYQHPVG